MPGVSREEETPLYKDAVDEDDDYSLHELDACDERIGLTEQTEHYSSIQQSARRRWLSAIFTRGHRNNRRRSCWDFFRRATLTSFLVLIMLIGVFGLLLPSYTNPPRRYRDISDLVKAGKTANVHNEKIFIAASLYDHRGELLSGQWAASVLQLIDMLGNDNVFLSIYEDNPDDQALAALNAFNERVTCQSHIVAEELDLSTLPHVRTREGTPMLKRITFLADVRNRALQPLEEPSSLAYGTKFDKLLYLNDIMFNPVDAANLLFSTNVDGETGRARYQAACATDFINPFKFYDTYATRDSEGYDMGVPFYPWFTSAGRALSRRDVLEQKDAVRVKSCWGGMVAFDAKLFMQQDNRPHSSSRHDLEHNHRETPAIEALTERNKLLFTNTSISTPLRFRASEDTYWDGSECCFIHADLTALSPPTATREEDIGIYINPYIRVAYSPTVLAWLPFTQRFERLYSPIHAILNWLASRPSHNPRQFQHPGEEVVDRVWKWDDDEGDSSAGRFEKVKRPALPGGFCGLRKVFYLNEHPREGEEKWTSILAPSVNLDDSGTNDRPFSPRFCLWIDSVVLDEEGLGKRYSGVAPTSLLKMLRNKA